MNVNITLCRLKDGYIRRSMYLDLAVLAVGGLLALADAAWGEDSGIAPRYAWAHADGDGIVREGLNPAGEPASGQRASGAQRGCRATSSG